ncbi:MAG: hypothetical protein O6947_04485 [Acidobacteria bacterium]|nr:hypothetical protein [Acidobacteriota bacterium]
MWTRRLARRPLTALAALLLAVPLTFAASHLGSKRYQFSPNQNLTIHIAAGEVEVTSILFEFPGATLGFRTANRARVKLINKGQKGVSVGLAISLFDKDDRLVGATTGGTKGINLKPGAETEYNLPFHHLTAHLERAAFFFIAMEIR